MTHGNVLNLESTMRTFVELTHHEKFSVIVSLDNAAAEGDVSETIGKLGIPKSSLVIKPDKTNNFALLSKTQAQERRVDDHLFFALRQGLESGAEFIFLVEDDLLLSPDFLQMLISGANSLRTDPTLFCISGWNEHSYEGEATDPSKLVRTGVFPGLGWMMHWKIVDELIRKWPGVYITWDWWFRRPDIAKGRECIVPEIPRSHHVGKGGVHTADNTIYDLMIRAEIPASDLTFNFTSVELTTYDKNLKSRVAAAEVLPSPAAFEECLKAKRSGTFLIPIRTDDERRWFNKFFYWFTVYRISHRGLVAKKKPEIGATYFFVHARRGAEWLPAPLRDDSALVSKDITVVISGVGEDCVTPCASQGFVCSIYDFGLINTCKHCPSTTPCRQTEVDSPTYRGVVIKDDSVCHVSEFPALNCETKINGYARVCPCRKDYDIWEF
jgi:hypothetical protein